MARSRSAADPTDVTGRRVGAWIVDVGLAALAVLIPVVALADSYTVPGLDRGPELEWIEGDLAVFFRSSVLVLHASELAVAAAALVLVAVPVFVLLPGRRGWSPGALAADIRLVDAAGEPPGVGRATARTVAWIIDGIPVVPLVGWVTMRRTSQHRRVGDLVAGTRVVHHHPGGRKAAVTMTDDLVSPEEPAPERAATSAIPVTEVEAAPPPGVTPDEALWDRRHRRYVMWHSGHGGWVAWSEEDRSWRAVGGSSRGRSTPHQA